MDEYRERQRRRWGSGESPAEPLATQTTPVAAPAASQSPSVGFLSKIHILPVTPMCEAERVSGVSAELKLLVAGDSPVAAGGILGGRFVVVRTEPDSGGRVGRDTDFFVDGPVVERLNRIQLIALVDPQTEENQGIADRLFTESVAPFIQSTVGEGRGLPVWLNQTLTVGDNRYVVNAMDPEPEFSDALGLVTPETTVFIDLEQSGDFTRIHVLPFQDTLPRVYNHDTFTDYLRPFFLTHPLSLFSANTQFTFRGVQFKIVCVEPSDGRPRRVGPSTLIHCDGLLHSSLRTVLPPDLLEQLSTLPPGLQMLLVNSELLASGDMLDRFIDLQETLSARRGVSEETLRAMATERFCPPPPDAPESNSQCMICLSDFEQDEEIRRLPCAHFYHSGCIDEWLRRCTDCPLCKTNVETAMTST
jgi:hypothetical protein